MVAVRGHARRWGAYAALGIAAALWSWGQIQANPKPQAVERHPSAAQQPAPTAPVQPQDPPAKYQPVCDQPRDEGEYAACAEAKSAKEAGDQLTATWWQVGGLGATLIVTAWAAWSAARAAKVAKKAADDAAESIKAAKASADAAAQAAVASHKQADVAEKALYIVERPWLYVIVNSDTYIPAHMRRGISVVSMSYHFKNAGRTYATVTEIFGYLDIVQEIPSNPGYTGTKLRGIQRIEVGDSSGSNRVAYERPITDVEFNNIVDGALKVIFFGYVRYRDVFQRLHTTGFGLVWMPEGPGGFSAGPMESYNYESTEEGG
jgi:hypothetical protein